MERPLTNAWPGVCILWAMVSSSAYANAAQDVTTDVCDALAPCIVQLNAVASDRVVRCENGVVSYEITQEFKVSGYKLGQFRLPEEMPLIPGLESWISGSHAWDADGLRKYSEYQKFAYSVVDTANDIEEWGETLRACLNDALPKGYTAVVHSEFTATGRGQSDAQDFNTRSTGQADLQLAREDRAALTDGQKEEYQKVAQSDEYAKEQIPHVQLGLLRIFFADNWAYDHLKDKVGKLWSEVFPNAKATSIKRNPPRYERLGRAEKSGDEERFAALHVVVSLRVAIKLPSPLPKPPAPPSPRPPTPEESENEEDCVKCWETWLRWTCLTCERGLKSWFWPGCCKGPVQILWPPCWWCGVPSFAAGRLVRGGGVVGTSLTPIPYVLTYEGEVPMDLCLLLRLRFGLVGYLAGSPPPDLAGGGGFGIRGRFWNNGGVRNVGAGFEARYLWLGYEPMGERSGGSIVPPTAGIIPIPNMVGVTVAIEPLSLLLRDLNLDVHFGALMGEQGGGGYLGFSLYSGSKKPPINKGDSQ